MSGPEALPAGYARAALAGEVERVRSAAEGSRNDTLNRAAFALGQLVAAGALEPGEVAEELGQAALDAGLAPAEIRATVRSGLRGGGRHPRDLSGVGAGEPVVGGNDAAVLLPLTPEADFEARLARVDAWLREMLAEARPRRGSRIEAAVMLRSQLAGLPPVEPLVEGIMSRRAAVLLVGATGIGKTFLSLSFACSVGTGHAWLGRPVRRAKVLYVVGEGAAGLHARVLAWELAWNVKVTDDDVVFVVRPDSLAVPATWRELTELAVHLGVGLVILDTLSSLAPELDETKEAARMTRHLADLAASIDGTALLVHHPGWSDSTRSRGGYQLEANVDEVLVLTGVADSDLLELKRKKVKDGEANQRLWLRRRPYADSIVVEAANVHDIQIPMRTRILAVLADVGSVGITGPQLKAALGLADQQVSAMYKALQDLDCERAITSEGKRGRSRYFAAEDTR